MIEKGGCGSARGTDRCPEWSHGMKRQSGVWIAIICIMVIGVSITKMTSSFVASEPLTSLASVDSFSALSAEATERSGPETAALARNAAGAAVITEEVPDSGGEENAQPEPETGMEMEGDGEPAAVPEEAAAVPAQEESPGMRAAARAAVPDAAASEDGSRQPETEAAEESMSSGDSIQETVKSPLDPVRSPEVQMAPGQTDSGSGTADEFRSRFDGTAARIARYKESSQDSSPAALYMAAEYEWNLWDNELNAIYSAIRSRMKEEEKEDLRQKELEWIRTRDAEAEKAAGKNNGQASRNAAYMEALAAATRDRCYELLDEYTEVLNRSGN